jgi:hypothetical protein
MKTYFYISQTNPNSVTGKGVLYVMFVLGQVSINKAMDFARNFMFGCMPKKLKYMVV